MCKNEKRTHGTAATGVPVAEMIAREARRTRARGRAGARAVRVQRPLSMPFPGRSIERVLRDLATPSNYLLFKNRLFSEYAHIEVLVTFLLVKIFGFWVITRYPTMRF